MHNESLWFCGQSRGRKGGERIINDVAPTGFLGLVTKFLLIITQLCNIIRNDVNFMLLRLDILIAIKLFIQTSHLEDLLLKGMLCSRSFKTLSKIIIILNIFESKRASVMSERKHLYLIKILYVCVCVYLCN